MNKEQKKKKYGVKLAGVTAMSVAILSPNITSFAQPLHHDNKKDKETQFINIGTNDLAATVGQAKVSKVGGSSAVISNQYIPENKVGLNGNIMTSGTAVDYAIPVQFRSEKGLNYDFKNATLKCNPIITLANGKQPTAQQEKVIKQIEENLQINMDNNIKQWSSTGSYVLNGQITVGAATFGYKVNPNITLQYTNGDSTKSVPIKVPDLLLTSKYTIYLSPTVGSGEAKVNGKTENTITLGITTRSSEYTGLSKVDPNNPINSPINSITVHVGVDKKFKIAPINGDIKDIGNGNWVISGNTAKELSEGKKVNLFTYAPKDKTVNIIFGNVTINTIDADNSNLNLNNPKNGTYTAKNYPDVNGLTSVVGGVSYTKIKYYPTGVKGDVEVDRIQQKSTDTCNVQKMTTTFSSSIYPSTYGSGTFYSGSVLENGAIVCSSIGEKSGYPLSSRSDASAQKGIYVSLPQSTVNTLYNGTPEEKGEIFQGIVSGKIGKSYTYNQVISGKNIPILNFVYVKGHYNQKNNKVETVGATYDKVPYKVGNSCNTQAPIVSQTLTYFHYDKGTDLVKAKAAFKPYTDGIDEKLSTDVMLGNDGFITTNPNSKVTVADLTGNTYQSTETRDGLLSYGTSASNEYTLNYTQIHAAIDYRNISKNGDMPLSTNMNDLSTAKKTSWLNRNHEIEVNITTITPNKTAGLAVDAPITINVGTSFDITGKPTINGVPVKSYKVEGNKIIIIPGEGVLSNIIESNIKVGVHFTDPKVKNISLSATTGETKDNSPAAPYGTFANGIVNYVNGKIIKTGDSIQEPLTAWGETVNLFGNHANYCEHFANKPDSENNVTLTDILSNLNKKTTTYVIAGAIPEPGTKTLPGQVGYSGNGGLTTTINSINPNGAPLWVLPKSALGEGENQAILDSTNVSNLVGMKDYLSNPKNGWIKYKPGMSLKGMVGYMAMPTLAPGKNYKMTYNVKLQNVNSGSYQTVSSQYKYYDTNNKIGSTSPIVTLAPNGENLEDTWMSNVAVQNYQTNPDGTYKKGADGKYIKTNITPVPKDVLEKVLSGIEDVNGNKAELKDLINHGPNVDSDFDLTPTKLQNIVNLAYNDKALKEAGYKLDDVIVNGKEVNAAWFENVGIINNTGLTHVRFIISKLPKVPITQKVMLEGADGKLTVFTPEKEIGSGYPETPLNITKYTVPKGYEIVGATVNGTSVFKDGKVTLPKDIADNGDKVVYTIKKVPTGVVVGTIVTTDGKQIGTVPRESGIVGGDYTETPKIPEGYHLVKTTVDGKEVTPESKTDKVTGKYTNATQHIVWTVARDMGKVTTEVVDSTGKVLVQPISTTGGTGDKDTSVTPEVPKGYHLVKITEGSRDGKNINANGVEIKGLPSTYKEGEQIVVWHVEKNNSTVTVTIIDNKTGKVLVPPTKPTNIVTGSPLDKVKIPEIPAHYHIVVVDVNGVPSKDNKVTGIATPTPNHIVIKVEKNDEYPVDGKVVTVDGKVLSTIEATDNFAGETFTKTPSIPKGYYLIKTTLNGNDVSVGKDDSVTGKYDTTAQHIIWSVAKKPSITTEITTPDGKVLVPPTSTNGVPGTPTKGIVPPKIPKGYKIVKIVTDGGTSTDGIPPKFPNKSTTIKWVVEKADTNVDITVQTVTGSIVVPTSKPEVIKTDSKLSAVSLEHSESKIPYGYKIVGYETNAEATAHAKVDGTAITNDKDGVHNHIRIIVEKEPMSKITTEIITTTGKVLVPATSTTDRVVGSSTKGIVDIPQIPDGYHLVKVVTEGGDGVQGVPSKFPKNDEKVTWVVEKNNTTVDTTIKSIDGTVVVPTSKAEKIKTNSDLSKVELPKVPEGWKIVGYETDGGSIAKDVSGTAKVTPNHIVIIVQKIPKSSVTTEVIDSTGKIIVPPATTTGYVGGADTSTTPNIPAGYKIVKITDGSNTVDGVPKTYTKVGHTVIWHVVKINTTVDTSIVTQDGKVLVPVSKETTIKTGSDLTKVALPKIPHGYKVVGYQTNGSKVESAVTGIAIPTGNHIKIIVKKVLSTVDTTVETESGTIIIPTSKAVDVEIGSPLSKVALPKVPYGYKIIGYKTDGGKLVNGVEGIATANPNHIKIIVQKIPSSSITTIVKTQGGTILVPAKTITGLVGGSDTSVPPSIPKGYHIVKIVDGNGTNVTGVPSKYTNKIQTVTWIVQKDNTNVDATVETQTGQVVVPTSSPITIKIDSDLNKVQLPKVPYGWEIVGYETDGQATPVDKVEGNAIVIDGAKVSNHIRVIVKKKPTSDITIVVKTPDGKILIPPTTTTGVIGGNQGIPNVPTIPKGYKVVKIVTNTPNGGEVTTDGVPSTFPKYHQTISWVVQKVNTTVDTTIKTLSGDIVVPTSKEITIKTDSDLSKVELPNVPKGYKVVGYEVNGGTIEDHVSGTALANGNHIVTIVQKIPTKVTVVVQGPNGQTIIPPSSISGLPGTKVDGGTPIIPEGWKIVKITEGGHSVTGIPGIYPNDDVTIVWHVTREDAGIVHNKNNGNNVVNTVKKDLGLTHSSNVKSNGVVNPKTGDQSTLPETVGLLGAIAGLFILGKRKKKTTIEKPSK